MALVKDRRRNGTAPAAASEAEVEQVVHELEAAAEWERRADAVGISSPVGVPPNRSGHLQWLVEQLEQTKQ